MTRRLQGRLGGAITFLVVAALVIGGLGWVTWSALRVEDAQHAAIAEARLLNNLRIALWRLDSGMITPLGLEDNRPFDHYAPTCSPLMNGWVPANNEATNLRVPSPLLSCPVADWMTLHFQVDPQSGWSSPQVPPANVVKDYADNWTAVPITNVTDDRAKAFSKLQTEFDLPATLSALTVRESSLMGEGPPLAVNPDFVEWTTPEQPNPSVNPPNAAPESLAQSNLGPDVQKQQALPPQLPGQPMSWEKSYQFWGFELCGPRGGLCAAPSVPSPLPTIPPAAEGTLALTAPNGPPLPTAAPQQSQQETTQYAITPSPQQGLNTGNYRINVKGNQDRNNEYAARAQMLTRGMTEQKQAYDYYNRNSLNLQNGNVTNSGANGTIPPQYFQINPQLSVPQGGSANLPSTTPVPPGVIVPPPPAMVPPPTATPPSAALESAERKELKTTLNRSDRTTTAPTQPMLPIIVPAKPATLDQPTADFESPAPTDSPRRWQLEQFPAPTIVHLGAMRPQWIKAKDGTERLALVRSARLDNRVVYQGVLLDWEKLQAELTDVVKDLFPEAKLVPVHDPAGVSPERVMTALPVQLDPGPTSDPPPERWTPLRIGLALAWAAALIALAAVGLGGWSLLDLSERRIRFVSAVTHELRTPLTSLRLYLDLLTSGMITDEAKKAEYLQTLNCESDRLHRLIDNVLNYARLENRSIRAEKASVRVCDLVQQIRETWHDRCNSDGRELLVVSTVDAERMIVTDAHLVQQIVGNLIDNARKYSKDADDKRIWLWARPEGQGIVLEVEDRGPGIPVSERGTIFRPFRRGETADTTAGGAGLGLALARQWSSALGGKLAYRQADGGTGACFRLELA